MGRDKKNLFQLVAFMGMLYFGMSCSKTIHPLWFYQNHSIGTFAFAYSVMAFTGVFSFVFGAIADRWGTQKTFYICCFLYSSAMILRIFPNSYILAGLSGVLGGIGAGTVLINLRTWILSFSKNEDRVKFISYKNAIVSIALAIGTTASGWLVIALGNNDKSYVSVLAFAAVFPLFALFFIPRNKKTNTHSVTDKKDPIWVELKNAFREDAFLAFGIVGLSFISGVYTSLILPYLPIIFSNNALNIGFIGTLIAICSLAGAGVQIILQRIFKKQHQKKIFIVCEGIYALLTVLLAFYLGPRLIVVVVLSRAIISSLAAFAQELIELTLIEGHKTSLFFGIMQSAFLIGDMVGGGASGLLYAKLGISSVILIATGLISMGVIGLPFFCKIVEVRRSKIKSLESLIEKGTA